MSRHRREPSIKNKLRACGPKVGDTELKSYVSPNRKIIPTTLVDLYDFVGLTERFDESMVVMQDIMGIPMTDILYMSAKNSSAGQRGQADQKKNRKIIANRGLSSEPSEIQGLVNDTRWLSHHSWALRMHQAASSKIDVHIERIGRDEFAARLAEYRRLLAIARTECTDTTPKCYWNDNGCHYDCLDRISGYVPPPGHHAAREAARVEEDAANEAMAEDAAN